jgi:zinc/manganese transport system substrate-binding protein
MVRRLLRRLLVGAVMALSVPLAHADPVNIVAAESVYGDICRQIGGQHVTVVDILSSPDQDPHAFEAGASIARAIAAAQLVVYNGADYDAWMPKLLAASRSRSREVIEVARLIQKKSGDNPHVWYEPAAVSALSVAIADALTRIDPVHRADYAARRAAFETSMQQLRDRIAQLRKRHAGAMVTATEPVFEYMADALGLTMRNRRFQLAVMNGTEPSPTDIAAFENDLRTRAVRALIFNVQTSGSLAERMRKLAVESGVAVVNVTETEPPGTTYQQWIAMQLDALDRALATR